MPQKTVTVLSKPTGCQQCTATFRVLKKTDIDYIVGDATTDEGKARYEGLDVLQAPVVLIHDEDGNLVDYFSGFRPDKLEELKTDPDVVRKVSEITGELAA